MINNTDDWIMPESTVATQWGVGEVIWLNTYNEKPANYEVELPDGRIVRVRPEDITLIAPPPEVSRYPKLGDPQPEPEWFFGKTLVAFGSPNGKPNYKLWGVLNEWVDYGGNVGRMPRHVYVEMAYIDGLAPKFRNKAERDYFNHLQTNPPIHNAPVESLEQREE